MAETNGNPILLTQPAIVIAKRKPEEDAPVLLEYALKIKLDGIVCRSSTTMTFYNPSQRELEGELVFPLSDGTTVSGYAIDIEDQMVNAVTVTKEKARVTLEKEERRRVDPGIVEWTQGNQFRTRIYPLPAKGNRTVRIDTVSCIEYNESRRAATCRIPMRFDKEVAKFSVEVEVKATGMVRKALVPTITAQDWQDAGFDFESSTACWKTKMDRARFQPRNDVLIEFPYANLLNVQYERADQHVFFALPFRTEEIRDKTVKRDTTPYRTAKNVTIFWDCSGSRTNAGCSGSRELTLVGKILKSAGTRSIRLVPFRNDIRESEIVHFSMDTSDDMIGDVMDAIEGLVCDGASNFDTIGDYIRHDDCSLLFTDGMANWGDATPPRLDVPCYVFTSGSFYDATFLRSTALSSGGACFLPGNESTDTTVERFNAAMKNGPSSIFLESDNVELSISEIEQWDKYPILFLCGRIVEEKKPATVRMKFAGQTVKTYELDANDWSCAQCGDNVKKLFGQKKLEFLLLDIKTNESEITELGKYYSLVTPFTSMIVLETVGQYLRHKIRPPESQPLLLTQYLKFVGESVPVSNEERKKARYERVSEMWNERVSWWEEAPSDWKRWNENVRNRMASSDDDEEGTTIIRYRMASSDDDEEIEPGMDWESLDLDYLYNMNDAAERPLCGTSPLDEEEPQVGTSNTMTVTIKPWVPDSDYIRDLDQCGKIEDAYGKYIAERTDSTNSPVFYLQSANWFHERGENELAIRALSNLAEVGTEEPQVLRILGHRLRQWQEHLLAIRVFEAILAMRPEEPQSYRDLALTLAERATTLRKSDSITSGKTEMTRALELLNTVIMGRNDEDWDDRFPEIEVIALEEANALIPIAKSMGITNIPIDPRFIKLLEVDLRIVLTWHADNTDLDLWVIEPTEEKAYYGHRCTTSGGLVSCDYMDGYGPEEYLIRKAIPGKYVIIANFYRSDAIETLGEVIAQADVFTNFGRENQTVKRLTFPLREPDDEYILGEIEL